MESHDDIYLVACVAKKLCTPATACDIYVSPLFKKIRAYISLHPKPWFILSAEHGLLAPDKVIEPYDKTLNTMGVKDRKLWARSVFYDIEARLPDLRKVTFFAGMKYREFLNTDLNNNSIETSVPMYGMKIGEQLSWLTKQTS